ncbi:MAG: FlgO family outer membrane protein [Planctomycetota bacterium]
MLRHLHLRPEAASGLLLAVAVLALLAGCAPDGPLVYSGSNPQGYGAPHAVTYTNSPGTRAAVKTEQALTTRMKDLATQVANSLEVAKRPKVAVYDFITIDGQASPYGRHVAEELMMGLLSTGRVTLVERTVLQKALDELNFNATDAVDPEKSRQIGRIVGADAVAAGTISDYGDNVKVNARLVETETSTVMGFGSVTVQRDAFGGAAPATSPGGGTPDVNVSPGGNPDVTSSNRGSRRGHRDWHSEHGGDPWVGGASTPREAWDEFINGIAATDGERAARVVLPEEQWMLSDPNAMAIAYAFAWSSPRLGQVRLDGDNAYARYSWANGEDDVRFVRRGRNWFVILGE